MDEFLVAREPGDQDIELGRGPRIGGGASNRRWVDVTDELNRLKAECARLKADNEALRDALEMLAEHHDARSNLSWAYDIEWNHAAVMQVVNAALHPVGRRK